MNNVPDWVSYKFFDYAWFYIFSILSTTVKGQPPAFKKTLSTIGHGKAYDYNP